MRVRTFILYGLYFFTACLACAVILFPGEQVARRLSTALSLQLPLQKVDIADTALSFPPGLALNDIRITLGNGRSIAQDHLTLVPVYGSLLKPVKLIRFTANILQGEVSGRLAYDSGSGTLQFVESLEWREVQIRNLAYTNTLSDLKLSFDTSGRYDHQSSENKGAGQIDFSGLNIQSRHALFEELDTPVLAFAMARVDYTWNPGTLLIDKLLAKGPVMTLKLDGDVKPRGRFGSSPLDDADIRLKGMVQPTPAYVSKFAAIPALVMRFKENRLNGIPIEIYGTLGRPGIK
ncbi:MAG: type II secretion system protein GspN [Desulfobacteraceae bacterium]|nr:MAG: type II secretion system protein GspN [Desulfobacteraceae bacterium]